MNRHKNRKSIVVILSILCVLIMICTFPLVQGIKKTIRGACFVNGKVHNQEITITIDGYKQSYVFRKDKLNVTVAISDVKHDIKTSGSISPGYNGLYFVTVYYFDPIKNCYDFGILEFNKAFSVVIITGINENIYVASSNVDANLEEIFRIYGSKEDRGTALLPLLRSRV